MKDELRIQAKITPEAFREQACFDALTRRKRYRSPLLFLLIMAAFALICFTQVGRRENALLLGCVLLGVGLGLPAVYFLSFFLSVRKNAKLLAKQAVPASYTVILTSGGVVIPVKEKDLTYPWEQVFYAYRLRHSTCLYVEKDRAFMLSLQDPETEQRLWAFICRMLPADKCFDRRK